ncbi:MAG TPA: DUF3037 domain-containing protein [Cytophagaceae bacterium]|jgi:hypothetical protein
MQEKHLFEYAILRIVPKVEREEFYNVGVILYCKNQSFLKVIFHIDEKKLNVFSKDLEIAELQKRLTAFDEICCGDPKGGAIGKMPPVERFRWLISARSTIIQTSAVHPGLCNNAEETLNRLYRQLVL